MSKPLRVLVPVTGAFHGRMRVRRSTGTLDTEGLERILSEPSVRAISLAKQLQQGGAAELIAVHVDKGDGESVLREALAHGLDQAILIEGADANVSDPSTRAATIADVVQQHGPFDAIVGPAHSSLAGFSGALAAVAGQLRLPLAIGVRAIELEGDRFKIQYESIFGDYELTFPRPSVFLAGSVAPSYPTAWGIRAAFQNQGVLRVQADAYTVAKPLTQRRRIEAVKIASDTLEEVDGATLVRRLRSRSLVPEAGA